MTAESCFPIWRGRALIRHAAISLVLCLAAAAALGERPAYGQASEGPEEIGVIVAEVSEGRFADRAETIGTTRANEAVDITTTVADRVVDIRFGDGDQVRQGQILVVLERREEEAALASARATYEERKSFYERATRLVQRNAVSQAEVENRRAQMQEADAAVAVAKAELADRTIRAPFAGIMGFRQISVGAYLSPGDVIATLDDLDPIKLDVTVPSSFLSQAGVGTRLVATTSAFPGERFDAVITTLSSRVDPQTRSVVARALIDNPDRRLRPGLAMRVDLLKNERQALFAPEEAIVLEGERSFVFVVEEGEVAKREVVLGGRREGDAEITQGLTKGERVVTHGIQKVESGTRVRIQAIDNGTVPISQVLESDGAERAVP